MSAESKTSQVEMRDELEWLGYRPQEKMIVYGFSSVVIVDGVEVARKDCSGACQLPVDKFEAKAPGVLGRVVAAIAADRKDHLEMLAKAEAEEKAAEAASKAGEVAQ